MRKTCDKIQKMSVKNCRAQKTDEEQKKEIMKKKHLYNLFPLSRVLPFLNYSNKWKRELPSKFIVI